MGCIRRRGRRRVSCASSVVRRSWVSLSCYRCHHRHYYNCYNFILWEGFVGMERGKKEERKGERKIWVSRKVNGRKGRGEREEGRTNLLS